MNEARFKPRVRVRARWEWGETLGSRVVEVGDPPGASTLELPGPQSVPVRPYLDLFPSPAGIVARVVEGDGKVPPVAIRVGDEVRVSPLPEPPLALSAAAAGGLWVLTRGQLELRDAAGNLRGRHELDGMTLVGAEGGAVWAVGFETAWFLGADGGLRSEVTWPGGIDSAVGGTTLCCLERGERRRLRCLEPHGEVRFRTLGSTPGPFERLIGVAGRTVITHSGPWLRWADDGGSAGELTVQAAGLTASGRAFLSGRKGTSVELWIAGDPVRELTLPPAAPVEGPVTAVAAAGRRALVYGLDFAAHYQGDLIDRAFQVDDHVYRAEVFPELWSLGGPRYAVADTQGTILLSATGPTGVAVIAVDEEPRGGS